jgi:AraC-like DNA-binding protein
MRAVTLTSYFEVARFVGLDPYEMLHEVRIPPDFLDDPENRWAAAPIIQLLENSAARSGCDYFGLLMAECRTFPSLGPVSLLLQHLPTPGDVIKGLIDYRRHMNEILNFALDDDGDTAVIRWELSPQYALPQILDISVAMGYIVISGASGGRWQPSSVHFVRKAPAERSVVRRLFPTDVQYESSFNGFVCSSADLGIANPRADKLMASHAGRLLQLVTIEPVAPSIGDSTRRAITLLLPTGRLSLEHVAANVGVGVRALQRGLEKEGLSFAELVNETRREIACKYLLHFERPVTTVAELSGYSSLSSFTRWFVSEFGSAPNSWRAAQLEYRTNSLQSHSE